MIVYPAMDLMGGRIVRLVQGRFEQATTYSADPGEALACFAAAGATWAHVVDLDGARAGMPIQHDLLAKLAQTAPLRLQLAGGFRAREHLVRMFDAGVGRVVVGSLAVKQPELVRALLREFGGDRVTLSLDVRILDGEPIVSTSGWTEDSGQALWDVAARYPEARHLLLTDIGRDGMLAGPNFDLLREAVERLPHLAIQASGGVSTLDDLTHLRTAGVVVGKALWEGRFELAEAIRASA